MVAPALQTEGKQLQREQGVGMASLGRAVAPPLPETVEAHVEPRRSPTRRRRQAPRTPGGSS